MRPDSGEEFMHASGRGKRLLALYCIVRSDEGWSIQLNREDIQACLTFETAVKAAIHSAFAAHRRGFRVRVVVKDGRSLRTLWLHGRLPSEPVHRLAVPPALRARFSHRGWVASVLDGLRSWGPAQTA